MDLEYQVAILKFVSILTLVICSVVGYYSGYTEGYHVGTRKRRKESDRKNQKEKEAP